MTITGQVLTKIALLTTEQQEDVLQYIEKLVGPAPKAKSDAYGVCADLRTDLPFEEFQRHRREMWGNFPRDIEL